MEYYDRGKHFELLHLCFKKQMNQIHSAQCCAQPATSMKSSAIYRCQRHACKPLLNAHGTHCIRKICSL